MIRSPRLARPGVMGRVLRPNYAQRFLLPPALDEWVPASHPVRFVCDFVDSLDLAELGIEEPAGEEGRPPYAPDLLLKVWLFGYMERIRSTRGLEKACLQIMPFLWLTGNLHPDHNTLWRFFDKNRKTLPKLFKQLVKMAAEAELIGFALHALDGTKMAAVSSTDEALHRKSLEEKLKKLDELIAAYMQEVNTRAEADKGKDYAMPQGMVDEDARRSKIRALLERRLEDREDEKLLEDKSEPKPSATEQLPLQNDPEPTKSAKRETATKNDAAADAQPASKGETTAGPKSDPNDDAQAEANKEAA
jgi:transposase